MSNKNKYKSQNSYYVQENDFRYRPSMIGKIALYVAVPAAVIGIISVLLAFVIGQFLMVCIVSEGIAFVGGIVIVIDIVVSNSKNRKQLEKSGQVKKKEKDIANLIHFIVGLAVGILLGFFIWGFEH